MKWFRLFLNHNRTAVLAIGGALALAISDCLKNTGHIEYKELLIAILTAIAGLAKSPLAVTGDQNVTASADRQV